MIRRSNVRSARFYFCATLGAVLCFVSLCKNNAAGAIDTKKEIQLILGCAVIACMIWGVFWAVSRALGEAAPLVIDIRNTIPIDRSDPYTIILDKQIIIRIDRDDTVEEITVDGRCKAYIPTNEYCYLRIGDNRRLKIDAEYAYILVRILRGRKCKPVISGLGYLA